MPELAVRAFCNFCGNVPADGHSRYCNDRPVGRRYRCPVCARESYEGQRSADARHRTSCRWFGVLETGCLEPMREPESAPALVLPDLPAKRRLWRRRVTRSIAAPGRGLVTRKASPASYSTVASPMP